MNCVRWIATMESPWKSSLWVQEHKHLIINGFDGVLCKLECIICATAISSNLVAISNVAFLLAYLCEILMLCSEAICIHTLCLCAVYQQLAKNHIPSKYNMTLLNLCLVIFHWHYKVRVNQPQRYIINISSILFT